MAFTGISIVIPSFNDTLHTRKCLDAIHSAAMKLPAAEMEKLEIILVDDGSPQPFSYDTPPICFHYHRLSANHGAGAARNTGARLAKYSHLLFIDSDVLLEQQHLAVVFETLRNKNVKVLQGAASPAPANASPSFFHRYMAISWNHVESTYWRYALLTLCMVIDREFFFETGGFSEAYPGSGGEEFEFSARLWEIDPKAILFDNRLVCHHHYDGLPTRLKKLFVRGGRLRSSFMKHKGLPFKFKWQAGIRFFFSALLTFWLLWLPVTPLVAACGYLSCSGLFFITDLELSLRMVRHHSWRLAAASIFFRQAEYSTVLLGILYGETRQWRR